MTDWVGQRRRRVNMVTPRLFQRANFLTWDLKGKRAMLEDLRIDIVVNLWDKADPDLSNGLVRYLNWPMSGIQPPADASLLATFLANCMMHGRHVLVHCEAGRNRSVWLCARILVAGGADPSSALGIVKAHVPQAKVNSRLVADVYDA